MSNSLRPHGLYSPWNSSGQHTAVRSTSLLQGICPTQRLNQSFLHCRWILYQLSHQGSPRILGWIAYPFYSGFSWSRNWTRVSCIAGGFFTNLAIREAHIDWKQSNVHFLPWPLSCQLRDSIFFYVNWFLNLKIFYPTFFTICIYVCTYMGLPW